MRRSPERRRQRQRGHALVEVAVLLILPVLLTVGIVALIEGVRAQMAVNAVASQGVQTCAEATSQTACLERSLPFARDVARSWHLSQEDLAIVVDPGGVGRGAIATCTVTYTVRFTGLPVLTLVPLTLRRTERMEVQVYGNRYG